MSEVHVISVKLPEEVYQEMVLRIPEGERSSFIREAISEKLQKTPKPDKLFALEARINQLEQDFGNVKKTLSDLEILTYGQNKTNPYKFATDELDHKLIEYMLHYKGATTPELAEYTKTNRFIILNRLRKIQQTSKKQCGKPIIDYYAGERSGKKKAWWTNQDIIEEPTQ